jgi:ribosome recycling factor
MIKDIHNDASVRMQKSIEALRHTLVKVRTGRASTALVEHLKVNYYGSDMPLSQVASIAVTDARSLTITPWEKQMVGAVEKAILGSDLGLTPNTAGTVIRLNLPALTEERRKELSKVVHGEGEDTKVAIRNIRRDANHHVKELLKDKQVTEDEAARSEAEIQKMTDKAIKDVDEVVKAKEQELLAV